MNTVWTLKKFHRPGPHFLGNRAVRRIVTWRAILMVDGHVSDVIECPSERRVKRLARSICDAPFTRNA